MANKPQVTTDTQPSVDQKTDRLPITADTTPSEGQVPSETAAENVEAKALIPLIQVNGEETLNPAFILHCISNHPNAFGKKGWKETQMAVTGHKGQLSDAEKDLIGKVFKMLCKHAKAESTAFVENADFVEVRSNKRTFDDRNHTAERTTMLRCTRGIEYSA